jgi:hypothetical protein
VRFAPEEFVIIIDRADSAFAVKAAQSIQERVENRSTWPGGIAALTISQGISTCPDNGTDPTDLIVSAESALFYAREKLGANNIFHTTQMPVSYRSATQITIDGDLSVFDAGGLLQSVANSQKTGVLTVQSSSGKQLWTLFENGKPTQARLGKFKGDVALGEFMVTFTNGNFSFQEVFAGRAGVKLPKLDDSYNIHAALDHIVINGALAQDNYHAARVLIPSIEVMVKKVSEKEFTSRWGQLKDIENPPTSSEYKIMEDIARYADGNTTLAKIFKQFESVPSHELWHSCAIMIQQGLLAANLPQAASSLRL